MKMSQTSQIVVVGEPKREVNSGRTYNYLGTNERGQKVLVEQRTSYPRDPHTGKMSLGRRLLWLVSLGVDWKHTT